MKNLIRSFVWIILATCLCVVGYSSPLRPTELTDEQIQNENQFLASLGLELNGENFLSARPFDLTATNSRPLLLPVAWYTIETPRHVKASDLLLDLAILENVMRMQYSGWEVAIERGWDWSAWFSKWRETLVQNSETLLPIGEAFGPILELKKILPDNHSIPLTNDRIFAARSATVLLENLTNGPCERIKNSEGQIFNLDITDKSTQPHAVRIGAGNPNYTELKGGSILTYPRNRGTVSEVECSGIWQKVTSDFDETGKARLAMVLQLAQLQNDQPHFRKLQSDIGYLRMPSMIAEHTQKYADLAANISKSTDGKEKVLIVDLRGNRGGNLYLDVLSPWYSKMELFKIASKLVKKTTTKTSALAASLNWGGLADVGYFLNPSPAALLEIESVFKSLMTGATIPPGTVNFTVVDGGQDAGATDHLPPDLSQNTDRTILLVLIDDRCGSNCEKIAGILSQMPQGILAGVNTYGVGEFGDVGVVLLPNTRVPFRLAKSRLHIYKDLRSFDGYGISPDILLNSAESNSPNYIEKLAESLLVYRP